MKKTTPNSPQSPDASANDDIDSSKLSDPISHFFTLHPNLDTLSLLAQTCETLGSLNVMSTNLAHSLESPHRNAALAILQLAELAGLLVNRALENLDPPAGLPETPSDNAL
ncbi:DUF6124 family protein [Pseudomonas sp. Y24-6]|uniref:DUF6124 family protein n=1 Tax=Pseudomonas sp. Y24-6 TaxID=2750013 RepID=UPI001CE14581|nr:DUF6124 family protein [Pseudomonas sp. Y24-6]MCA4964829.1 hypothetical protein [Pseudomonas sp. Y24-6]